MTDAVRVTGRSKPSSNSLPVSLCLARASGRSHSPSFHLWTEGEMADPALKRFAEDGDSVLYDSQPQGYHGVFDTFYADPIRGGEGRTSTFLLADGLHSKVGLVRATARRPAL